MSYLKTLWELLRLFWRLRNGTETSDAKFVRCYLELFLGGGGAATKIPDEIKSVGFVSAARLCHEHKMSASTYNFFFAKKELPEKARNVLYSVWLLIWTRPEHYLCYQAQAQAHADLGTGMSFSSGNWYTLSVTYVSKTNLQIKSLCNRHVTEKYEESWRRVVHC
jgi:hypothetical protein